MKLVLICCVIIYCINDASSAHCDDRNAAWTNCGTSCPQTCDNYKKIQRCDQRCNPGCFCRPPYIENNLGHCVLPRDCRKPEPIPAPVCGQNQEWNGCESACPLTCDNYDNPPDICTLQCVVGCACKKGYVKNAQEECVLPEQCPSRGGRCNDINAAWNNCGTSCPQTCDNYKKLQRCDQRCNPGCFCRHPYIENHLGHCVLPRDCRKPVNVDPVYQIRTGSDERIRCPGRHMKYSPCSSHCQPTCDNYWLEHRMCTRLCSSGCICEPPYVKSEHGCILPRECPAPKTKTVAKTSRLVETVDVDDHYEYDDDDYDY